MDNITLNRRPQVWFWPLVLSAGALVRFFHLGQRAIWLDEAYSLNLAGHSFGGIIHGAAMDIHPPLFHLLLAVWIKVFGSSEWGLRSLSACLGLLLIPVVYQLVKRLANQGAAQLAALLAAFSPYFIELSRVGRMPALLALLQALALLFFWRFLGTGKLKDMILFFIIMLAALYTHYFAFLLLGSFYVFIFMGIGKLKLSRDLRQKWFLLQFALIAGYAPWLVTLWDHFLKGGPGWRGMGATWTAPLKLIYHLLLSTSCYTSLQKALAAGLLLLGLGLTTWALRHRLRVLYQQLPARLWGLLVTILLFTIGVVWLYSRHRLNVFDHRYLSSVALVLVVIFSTALNLLESKRKAAGLLLVLAGFAIPGYNQLFHQLYFDDWRAAARVIGQEHSEQTVVAVYPPWNETPLNYYLKNTVKLAPLPGRYDAITGLTEPYYIINEASLPQVSARLQGADQVVLLLVNEGGAQAVLAHWFEQHYHLAWHKTLGGLHLWSGRRMQEEP